MGDGAMEELELESIRGAKTLLVNYPEVVMIGTDSVLGDGGTYSKLG